MEATHSVTGVAAGRVKTAAADGAARAPRPAGPELPRRWRETHDDGELKRRGRSPLSDTPAPGDGRPGNHEGEAVLARAVSAYRTALGSRLIAGYALGSLAHGGFSPLVSDVDLGLILQDPVRAKDRATIYKVARSVRAGEPGLKQRLSGFWGPPSTLRGQSRGGRFPPLDRLDLLDYGRLLTGRDARSGVARPER